MVRAEARSSWHLKRGQKIYSPISRRELRLLAELGHLRPGDSVWRPGLASWIPASSAPGVPPLLPPPDSQTRQWDLTRIGALFLTRMSALFLVASNEFCRLSLSAREYVYSVKGALQRAYNRPVSRRPNLDLIEVACRRPRQGIVAGLLVMVVFVGALDFAMKSSSATGNKVHSANSVNKAYGANSVVPKFEDRPSTELATPTAFRTKPSELKPALDLKEVEVFDVSNGHAMGRFVLASNVASVSQAEAVAQPHKEPNPTPVFQSEVAATSDEVPLPTRKPDKPSVKAQANRIVPREKRREPKPMQFGTIGYNYSPQQ